MKRNNQVDAAVEALRKNPHRTITAVAKDHGVPRTTLRDAVARQGEPVSVSTTVQDLLRAQGLDPAEWEVKSANVRGDGVSLTLRPRVELDLIPDPLPPLPAPRKPLRAERSFVICGDQHAPHQDPGLHEAFCSFLSDETPDELVVLGDVADYASVSRHRSGAGYAQGVIECNRAAYKLLHDYRESSPDTYVTLLEGNHDARVENYLQDNAPELWQVGPAFEEDLPMYSLRRMWRLDELDIDLVEGDWDRSSYKLTPTLSVRHGYLVSQNTPQQMLNKHGRSQVQGHDHKLRFTYRTKHDPTDTRVHVSTGCMCKVDEEGLGYAVEPDWNQGFVYGHAWDNGDFALAPAVYVPDHGLLLPDGRRY